MLNNNDNDSFLKELLNDFRVESIEHYESIVKGLLDLEKNDTAIKRQDIIERVYRDTHSLKGAARAVNLPEIERLCSTLESIFGYLKKGEITLSSQLLDILHKALDVLKILIDNLSDNKQIKVSANSTIKNLEYIVKLSLQQNKSISGPETKNSSRGNQQESLHQESSESEVTDINGGSENSGEKEVEIHDREIEKHDLYSVRITTGHLHQILSESEDFIAIKTTLDYYRRCLENIHARHKDEELYNLIKDLISFQKVSSRMIDDLIINIRETLLSNFSTLFRIVPKMVRDLSREYSKEISFNIKGEETEIDRRILEDLKDPLIHLIRNCIDHGIETPQERVDSGKELTGRIDILIEKLIDRKVRITISDDGAGINLDNVLNSAIKNGVLGAANADNMSKDDIISLIFKSGVSSKKFVTDISGRGLGMSIVAEKISNMGGSIEVTTEEGKGSSFTITLPQTISTFRGVLVESDGRSLMIPSVYVEKAVRVSKDMIGNIGDKSVIKCVTGETLGVVRLSTVLGIEKNVGVRNERETITLLILTNNNKRVAFITDKIVGEYEGIVKDMGPQLKYVRNIAGVTIIENGRIVPVVNVNELIESTSEKSESYERFQTLSTQDNLPDNQKRVLIVEDSLTIRSMLKNFVESAGYDVMTAVDGLDAFSKLESENFDLIVSDIEMPRMNGFDLTKKVRQKKENSDIPVILVTALESAGDMKRGMEAGADAYIIKSSFEKSNLIETIRRFI
jgi:two-component system chemotaxis sensor kinase CheA